MGVEESAGVCPRCGRAAGVIRLDGGQECVDGCGYVSLDDEDLDDLADPTTERTDA